jgi:c-di-GMP-binding flagellar brake protein YcgR
MSEPAVPGKKSRPENMLFHSRIEIRRIMHLLALEQSPVSAEIKNGHPFSSHILSVDTHTDHFTIAYSPHKAINAMVLESLFVEFTATDRQDMHFTFDATAPEETLVDDQPAIQFALPKSLLLHNRREFNRKMVNTDLSLRCIADAAGVIPFESHVTDVSHDGLGCLIYDMDVMLEPNTILKGCRIIIPGGDSVEADLELRHITSIALPDGTMAHRAGFRFVEQPDGNSRLVKVFIEDLGKQ